MSYLAAARLWKPAPMFLAAKEEGRVKALANSLKLLNQAVEVWSGQRPLPDWDTMGFTSSIGAPLVLVAWVTNWCIQNTTDLDQTVKYLLQLCLFSTWRMALNHYVIFR